MKTQISPFWDPLLFFSNRRFEQQVGKASHSQSCPLVMTTLVISLLTDITESQEQEKKECNWVFRAAWSPSFRLTGFPADHWASRVQKKSSGRVLASICSSVQDANMQDLQSEKLICDLLNNWLIFLKWLFLYIFYLLHLALLLWDFCWLYNKNKDMLDCTTYTDLIIWIFSIWSSTTLAVCI